MAEPLSRGAASGVPAPEGFVALASRPAVVRRALRYAVFVGAILIAINHGDALVNGDLTTERVLRMLLTCLVPYCVSTASSVEAIRAYQRVQQRA